MTRAFLLVLLIAAASASSQAGEQKPSEPACWFQCGPGYNPFVGQVGKDEVYRDADYVGGYRGEISAPLPGEYGYRHWDDGRGHSRRHHH